MFQLKIKQAATANNATNASNAGDNLPCMNAAFCEKQQGKSITHKGAPFTACPDELQPVADALASQLRGKAWNTLKEQLKPFVAEATGLSNPSGVWLDRPVFLQEHATCKNCFVRQDVGNAVQIQLLCWAWTARKASHVQAVIVFWLDEDMRATRNKPDNGDVAVDNDNGDNGEVNL